MKNISLFLLILICIFLGSCVEDNGILKKGNAEVIINVATRGSYQFIIQYENNLYYPVNLPESYKTVQQEPIPVYVIFSLTGKEADLFKPAPNDASVFFKSIPEINITTINSRN